jgi:DNA topoisomerase-2
VEEIANDYYETRLGLYEKRKAHQLTVIGKELQVLSNKAKYIQELLDGSIDLRRKRGDELISMLKEKGYDETGSGSGSEGVGPGSSSGYKYLLKLPMDSVSEENVDRLVKEKETKTVQYETLRKTSPEQLWLTDLNELREEYMKQEEKRLKMVASIRDGSGTAMASAKPNQVRKLIIKKK